MLTFWFVVGLGFGVSLWVIDIVSCLGLVDMYLCEPEFSLFLFEIGWFCGMCLFADCF